MPGMICPSCRHDVVPIVRGVRSFCTACGAQMPVLAAGEALNVVGQPAKVGGGIAKFFGWLVLAGGFAIFALMAVIGWAISVAVPFYIGAFFAVVATLIAAPLLFAGNRLSRAGEDKQALARERAVFALAAQHRGVLSVPSVARALEIQEADADALLTAMAKRPDARVSLEVDDQGTLTYQFRDLLVAQAPERVRVGAEGWRVPAQPEAQAPPKIVDAELIEEDDVADPQRRQLRR
jgi:hypothetical protein